MFYTSIVRDDYTAKVGASLGINVHTTMSAVVVSSYVPDRVVTITVSSALEPGCEDDGGKACTEFKVSYDAIVKGSQMMAAMMETECTEAASGCINLEQFSREAMDAFLCLLHRQTMAPVLQQKPQAPTRNEHALVLKAIPVAIYLDAPIVTAWLVNFTEANPTLDLLIAFDEAMPDGALWSDEVHSQHIKHKMLDGARWSQSVYDTIVGKELTTLPQGSYTGPRSMQTSSKHHKRFESMTAARDNFPETDIVSNGVLSIRPILERVTDTTWVAIMNSIARVK